jgi:peptidoglycan/LPS O-acetylase OafA/YrhL
VTSRAVQIPVDPLKPNVSTDSREQAGTWSGRLLKSSPGRIQSFDGVRGVFSLLVFAGHVFIRQMQGGIIAVDMFFLLSGYLITSLLLKEQRKTGTISLGRFYTRRMLRLYPLLAVVVLVTFVPAVIDHIEKPVPDSLAALFYVTNFWRQFQPGNYINLVINTWSLGVEEQFYLCWPIIMIVALRRQWSLTKVLIGLAIGTFALTGAIQHAHLSFVGVLAWLPSAPGPELASGALLAVLQTKPEVIKWVRRGVGWPVALASFVLIFVVTFHGMHRWWMFGGVTVIVWPLIAYLALVPEGWLSKALCFRPAVWLGERSYAIYLLQIPVVVLLSRSVHSWYGELLIGLPLTLALAELSWRFVEQPFLRLKTRYETPGVAVSAGAAQAADPQTTPVARNTAAGTTQRAGVVIGRINIQ